MHPARPPYGYALDEPAPPRAAGGFQSLFQSILRGVPCRFRRLSPFLFCACRGGITSGPDLCDGEPVAQLVSLSLKAAPVARLAA